MSDVLLKIENLSVAFGPVTAVTDVNLVLHHGEFVALVGESGSGKTVTALMVARLLGSPPVTRATGRILFRGEDVMAMPEDTLRSLRGSRIAYVFQEPATALNPVFTAGEQIGEALALHGKARGGRKDKIISLLEDVGIREPARVAGAYPHQLSGGQQQRVMLAMALACEPDLLIADEPTTALDVTVQAQILELLKRLQARHGMAVLFITHNLAIAAAMADRIAVMYAGQMVESGPARALVKTPRHPYTKALLEAVPKLEGVRGELHGIPGQIPSASSWPAGCRFHPRCPMVRDRCRSEAPEFVPVDDYGHGSRCFFAREMVAS